MKQPQELIPVSGSRKALISIILFAHSYFHEPISIGEIDAELMKENEPPLTQEEIKTYKLDRLETKAKK